MEPTMWFVAREGGSAARWYWPESTRCEVIHAGTGWEWVELPLDVDMFLDLNENRYAWRYSTEAAVAEWITQAQAV